MILRIRSIFLDLNTQPPSERKLFFASEVFSRAHDFLAPTDPRMRSCFASEVSFWAQKRPPNEIMLRRRSIFLGTAPLDRTFCFASEVSFSAQHPSTEHFASHPKYLSRHTASLDRPFCFASEVSFSAHSIPSTEHFTSHPKYLSRRQWGVGVSLPNCAFLFRVGRRGRSD
jgi:hypothetical protein